MPRTVLGAMLPCFAVAVGLRPEFPSAERIQFRRPLCSPVMPARRPSVTVAALDDRPPPGLDSSAAKPSPIRLARDFLAGISRVAGLGRGADGADLFELDSSSLFDDNDEPPEVLVVGATGEAGRIIVRKLLLRGYKVRVLVRNLYSSTLDLLGSGVSFVKGDVNDYDSLLECLGDVDKVICSISANKGQSPEDVDYTGVSNLIRAFHDGRMQNYGRAEATKLRLFDFSRDEDLDKWKVVAQTEGQDGARPPRVSFKETTGNRIVFLGQVFSVYSGVAEVRTVPAKFNLQGFSGLIMRCIGDGKTYRVVLRTLTGVKDGIEYVATFTSRKSKWESVRLPLSQFVPRSMTDGFKRKDAPALNRAEVRQMAIQYGKPEQSPEKDDGRFYLGVDYIKTYRTQEEPDFVLVSCASVSSRNVEELEESGLRALAERDTSAWKYMAEKRLRNSGLTYCIVRPGTFTDQPGGNKSLMLEQDGDMSGVISRADLAEVCVKSLLDPRACNVTFDAFESIYAPSVQTPNQDLSSLLGRLRPNT
jgi:uncharacterized protein YbjT (DUF2867 family)